MSHVVGTVLEHDIDDGYSRDTQRVYRNMKIGLLVERLAKHRRIGALLEQTTSLPDDELLESLLKEFEQVVERYNSLSVFAAQARAKLGLAESSVVKKTETAPRPVKEPRKITSKPLLSVQPIQVGVTAIDLKAQAAETAARIEARKREDERKRIVAQELKDIEKRIQDEIQRDWDCRAGEIHTQITRLKQSREALIEELESIVLAEHEAEQEVEVPNKIQEPEIQHYPIEDDDLLYVHGVAVERETQHPNNKLVDLNEDGISGKRNLFAVTVNDLRFYVSKISSDVMTVTESGVLLLSKRDSIRYRSEHNQIVNRLRLREKITPFEFAVIIRGSEWVTATESTLEQVRTGIMNDAKSVVWTVQVSALDHEIEKHVEHERQNPHGSARTRQNDSGAQRVDVKLLEKLLQEEKRIAEMIHKSLSECSGASMVESIVGIGSGISDDWKLILQGAYEVSGDDRQRFLAQILRLQEGLAEQGVLLSVENDAGLLAAMWDQTSGVQTASA